MCIQSVSKKRRTLETVLKKLRRYALEDCAIWMMFLVERIFRGIYLVLLIWFCLPHQSNQFDIWSIPSCPFRSFFLFGTVRRAGVKSRMCALRNERWRKLTCNHLVHLRQCWKVEKYKSSSIRKKERGENWYARSYGGVS